MITYVKSIYLQDNKTGFIALSNAIKGIGINLAKTILRNCNIDINIKVKDWDKTYADIISLYIDNNNILINESLDDFNKKNIDILKRIGHRRGIRLSKGLSLHNGRGRTAKKLNPSR